MTTFVQFKISRFYPIFIIALVFSVSCNTSEVEVNRNKPAGFVAVDPQVTYQTIAGFGGADGIFNGIDLSDTEAQLAFGTGAGELGMSIFRVKLPYNPNDWSRIVDNSLQAQQFPGVKLLASPWSPPPALKSNNSAIRGELLPENYGAYVDHINDFIGEMSANGVDIHAISIQNEPDWEPNYESCDWTASQMRDFLREHGGDITGALVSGPESLNFSQGYTNVILNDDEAAANLDILAGHIYGGGLAEFPLAEQKNKEIWMTEHLYNLGTGNTGDPFGAWEAFSDEEKWEETMQMLEDIHVAMTYNWNAYIWWYTKRYYSFIGDGTTNDAPVNTVLKRGYAFSHYSKFIRPGYVRVNVELQEVNNELMVTAYSGEGNIVLVILNPNNVSVGTLGLTVSEEAPASVTAYTTSLSRDVITVDINQRDDGILPISVPANSVMTLIVEE